MKKSAILIAALLAFSSAAHADYKSDFKARYDVAMADYTRAKQAADTAYKECLSAQQACLNACQEAVQSASDAGTIPPCDVDCGKVGLGCQTMAP